MSNSQFLEEALQIYSLEYLTRLVNMTQYQMMMDARRQKEERLTSVASRAVARAPLDCMGQPHTAMPLEARPIPAMKRGVQCKMTLPRFMPDEKLYATVTYPRPFSMTMMGPHPHGWPVEKALITARMYNESKF